MTGKKADKGYDGFSLFKDVKFCKSCRIIMRGCFVGQSREFVQAVANATGCQASAFSSETLMDNKTGRPHPPGRPEPDVNMKPEGSPNLEPYLK